MFLIQVVVFTITSFAFLFWYYEIHPFLREEVTINESFIPTVILLSHIKNNRLSLKSLEQKLEQLAKENAKKEVPEYLERRKDSHRKDDNSNNENIIVRIRKGGAPMLFILSTILAYANRIPIINRLTGYITMKYANTSWLQLLIRLRKLFIIFNAVIGIITVFKVTGYSSDNMIAGFYGLGSMGKERILKCLHPS